MIMVCGINCNIQNSNRKISKIILYFVWVFIIIFIGPQMKDFWNILPSDSLYSMIDAITSPASTSLVDQSVSNTSGWKLFPNVSFHMSAQRTWIRACKITLIAFVWLFSSVRLQCILNLPASEDTKSHRLHLFDFSPLCIFKCVLKLPAREDA